MFSSQVQAALAAGAAAILTWQVLPLAIDPDQNYDFTWDSDGGQVIQALTAYASCQARVAMRTTVAVLQSSPGIGSSIATNSSTWRHKLVLGPWNKAWAASLLCWELRI